MTQLVPHGSGWGGCRVAAHPVSSSSRPVCPAGPGSAFPQVGAIGDEEEWVSLYEEENEPDTQTLEIPNLTPYTQYR